MRRFAHKSVFLAVLALGLAACQPAQTASTAGQTTASDPVARSTSGRIDGAQALVLAARARDACTAHMPDNRATRAAFDAAGIPSIGSEGSLWLQTPSMFDMVAFVNTTGGVPRCGVVVRGMTVSQSETLIQPWFAAAGVQPASANRRNGSTWWEGQFRGGPVRVGIIDELNISGFVRGSAIAATALSR